MKWHLFYLSSLICILTLVSSACAAIPTAGREQTNLPLSLENIKNSQAGPQQVESNGAMDQQRGSLPPTAGVSANNQTAGSNVTTGSLPPAADMQVEGQVPASNPSGSTADSDTVQVDGQTAESNAAYQVAGKVGVPPENANPADMPSLQERDKMLNGVNASPPITQSGSTSSSVAGPIPGTESGPVTLEKPISPSNAPGNLDNANPSPDINVWSIKAITGRISAVFRSIFIR